MALFVKKFGFLIVLFFVGSSALSLAENYDILSRFDAVLIITNDQHLSSKWDSSFGVYNLPIHSVERVYKGEIIEFRVLLRNMTADEKGSCNVSFDIEITSPTGSAYFLKKGIPALQTQISDVKPTYLATGKVRLNFHELDMFGKYSVRISVTDHVGNQLVTTGNEVVLIAYGKERPKLSEAELTDYLSKYYLHPNPHLAIDLLKVVFAVEELQGTGDYAFKMSAMFRTIFKENPYLIPYFVEYLNQLELDKRRIIYPVIKAVSMDYPNLLKELITSGEERRTIAAISYPNIWDDRFETTREIDMIWASFSGSGDIGPIRQIIQALKLVNEKDDYRFLIGNTAVQSLTKHCKQSKLIKAHCIAIWKQKDGLESYTREILGKCIFKHSFN